MIEAIVLDLDGTLLNSKKEVSHVNLQAIERCLDYGIKIIIATARPPRSVKSLLPFELIRKCSFIYYNGANIEDKYYFSIDKSVSSEIIDYLLEQESGVKISIESKDKWYSHQEIELLSFGVSIGPEYLELESMKNLEATKLLISNFSNIQGLQDKYREKVNILITDRGSLIQIMAREVSKENAVLILCQKYNINISKVVSFGDDYNDLGLFHECGYSVAMGNAITELKELATLVTYTNDNDGVAEAIEWFLNDSYSEGAS